jgi:polysaccharide export outer membrane protein
MKTKSLDLRTFYLGILTVLIFLLHSCAPAKNVVYFENLQKDTTLHNLVTNNLELKIRKNDLLVINIISPDPVNTPYFNGSQYTSTSSGTSAGGSSTGGFLIDNDGNITVYKLGIIHVEGLTRSELKYKLQKDLEPYLKDAVVTVRFLNNHITLLGEVAKPQVLSMPNERIPLLEAIGQAGDLTITGRRDNVLVIRETPNGKQFKRLNLTDNSIFNSPFYYLKPDDVVYVEPTKIKINSSGNSPQIIGYLLSGISIFITLLVYLLPHK